MICFVFVLGFLTHYMQQIVMAHLFNSICDVLSTQMISAIIVHKLWGCFDHFSCLSFNQSLKNWQWVRIKVISSALMFDDLRDEAVIRKEGHFIWNECLSNLKTKKWKYFWDLIFYNEVYFIIDSFNFVIFYLLRKKVNNLTWNKRKSMENKW